MKVWVVIVETEYEGCGEPEAVFSTEALAYQYVAHLPPFYRRNGRTALVREYDVQDSL